MRRGPQATYVSTVEELNELVLAVQESGEFCFDVETRGNVNHHSDVLDLIEREWQDKKVTLKTAHPAVIERSHQAIVDRWQNELPLDTLRNEVFWIGIAIEGRSWAIPMGHPNGEVLVKAVRGDGSTIPPPGHRKILASGKESLSKAKFFIPAEFTPPPAQLGADVVFNALEPLFMDEHIVKINQNIKFDVKSIAKYYGGALAKGLFIDTQVLMHIVNENLMGYSLVSILNHEFGFDPYWRDGKVGKTLTTEPFSTACRYVHYDVRWTWLAYKRLWRQITAVPSLYHALQIDLPTIRVVAQMELNGILVNTREMKNLGKELDLQMNNVIRDLAQHAPIGFNPDSTNDKLHFLFGKKKEGGLGLPVGKKTDSGKPSTDADTLEKLKGKHPAVDLMLEYAEVKKMKSTYVEGMFPLLHTSGVPKYHGRVHPQFHFHRTATGRFSCVSGATLLTTSRGTFRFDEYVPQEGDLVPTHTGAWKPVIRKIFKGYDPMVSVRLSNGSVLQCTEQHKVLTPLGWRTVGELTIGSEVVSHVGVKEVYREPGERTGSVSPLSGGRLQADYTGRGLYPGDHVSQRAAHCEPACRRGAAQGGDVSTLLTLQAGEHEPYAGQEWRAAPQSLGLGVGRAWLPTEEGGWEVRLGASSGVRRGARIIHAATVAGRAPHQRGQGGQLAGQPSVGHLVGAWEATCEVVSVAEVTPLGTMGVWDIEVADDHSYVTHGFLNHNSSDPNLQNIPRDGRMRSLFVAAPHDSLIVADYSQIEMRLMAMYSQDPALLEIFANDIDVHTGTATVILGRAPENSEERNIYGKVPNFLMGYGGQAKRLVEATGGAITLERGQFIVDGYNNGYAGLTTWKNKLLSKARKDGYVETMGGRRRRLFDLNAPTGTREGWIARGKAERQAINAVIQGTAAEICKEAMVRLDSALEWPKCKMLVQVHDELVTSVPTDELGLWIPTIEECMGNGTYVTTGKVKEAVKLEVEAHAAGSWDKAKG